MIGWEKLATLTKKKWLIKNGQRRGKCCLLNRSAFCTPLSVLNTPLLFALFGVHTDCGLNARYLWVRVGALTIVVECQYSFVTCKGRVRISELASFVFSSLCRNHLLLTDYRKATACPIQQPEYSALTLCLQ